MGKTPVAAISARRLKITPALHDNVRRRYEQTDEPLAAFAADLGCTVQTVCNIAKREGWVRYVAPPRDVTPAMLLRVRAERLAELQPTVEQDRASAISAGGLPPPAGAEDEAPHPTETAEALHRELNAFLADVRVERARMKREGYGKSDLQKMSHTIASLAATLRALRPMLRDASVSTQCESDYDDMPADLDEFREALARRIEAFMESRGDEADAFELDVDADDAARA